MADLTAKKVSKLIEEFRQTGKEPEKLVIGYKTYARLMADDKFAEALLHKPICKGFFSDIIFK
ncbi:hypothetical protein B9S44_06010 [Acinetobacter baumannii]|nr:hypothetical protein [Acinetobacter baumannii]OVN53741.1 hypothetical protein B4S38_08490 [Acinetobacter baumannii]OVO17423.1 hypothetical protein B9S44_06010 [Acinetobacter baumannii]